MGLDLDSDPNRQWIPHQIRFRTSIRSKFPVPDTHSGPNTIPTAQPLPELFICFLSSFSSLSFPLSLFPPSKIQYWQHRVVKNFYWCFLFQIAVYFHFFQCPWLPCLFLYLLIPLALTIFLCPSNPISFPLTLYFPGLLSQHPYPLVPISLPMYAMYVSVPSSFYPISYLFFSLVPFTSLLPFTFSRAMETLFTVLRRSSIHVVFMF